MKGSDYMGLKENIKKLRLDSNFTLEELAQKIGIGKSTLHKYESGEIYNIPHDKIELLAKALNTTPSNLMGWDELKHIISNLDEHEIDDCIEALIQNLDYELKFVSYVVPPKGSSDYQYFQLKHKDDYYKISINEYEELKRNINSYIKFKIQELLEYSKKLSNDEIVT